MPKDPVSRTYYAVVNQLTDNIDVAAAREKHNTFVNELNKLKNDIRSSSDTLERMHTGFGPEVEWKKLDGTCVEKVSGE